MKGSTVFKAASLLSAVAVPVVEAQTAWTHAATNITFLKQTIDTSQTAGGYQWGYALPPNNTGAGDEYIGYLNGALQPGKVGWAGISHGGGMPNSLLMVGWANGTDVKTTFVYAGGYTAPDDYTGNATVTQFYHSVNDTNFELVYRCQHCWVWNQQGAEGSQLPSANEVLVIGWAQHKANPTKPWVFHNNGQGQYGIPVAGARNAAYQSWITKFGGGTAPTPTPSGTPTPTTTSTPTPVAPTACVGSPAPTGSYDYIVVGGGAGGITVADKLSESGKSVLLIEKGPPSSGRWNGTMKPDWLQGTNLTRFDVPGLCNQIWVDPNGIACTDIDQMAGCVLGGGAAVNAALWWKANPVDWDYNFPTGWKSADMKAATERVFKRTPGTTTPSMDGKLYKHEGFDVLSSALAKGGWKEVTANDVPDQKNRTFAHPPFMYAHGERHGPIRDYLETAYVRPNFKLWMNTAVRRVVRTGGKATGVELDGGNGGYCGTVNLNPGGRVILSAGTFGSTKLLFRSGIGPKDQLTIVKNSVQDGPSMINDTQWINLPPVGQNLNDHVNTDLVVRHPNVSFYDFYQAWTAPIVSDKDAYLNNRTGILTQSAPNIGPLFWEVINGTDGIERSMQYTARVEPAGTATDNTSMTMSQYLGRGSQSRGVLSINGGLGMYVSKAPYLHDQADVDAVIASIKNVQKFIATIPEIVWEVPAPNTTVEDYVKSLPLTPSARRANHWIGTAKIGTDSGLTGGTSVVDLNTQVYGTDNIHVVDASLFPGHITTNPTGYILVVAEHAAEKILALTPSGGGGARPSGTVSASRPATPTASRPASPSATKGSGGTTPGGSTGQVGAGKQCGGRGYTGPTTCVDGYKCKKQSSRLSTCVPA